MEWDEKEADASDTIDQRGAGGGAGGGSAMPDLGDILGGVLGGQGGAGGAGGVKMPDTRCRMHPKTLKNSYMDWNYPASGILYPVSTLRFLHIHCIPQPVSQ